MQNTKHIYFHYITELLKAYVYSSRQSKLPELRTAGWLANQCNLLVKTTLINIKRNLPVPKDCLRIALKSLLNKCQAERWEWYVGVMRRVCSINKIKCIRHYLCINVWSNDLASVVLQKQDLCKTSAYKVYNCILFICVYSLRPFNCSKINMP